MQVGQVVIELDGYLYHGTAHHRDRDFDRGLEAAVSSQATIRLGWGQVFDRPCQTAARLARVFSQHGWSGLPRRCGESCVLSEG